MPTNLRHVKSNIMGKFTDIQNKFDFVKSLPYMKDKWIVDLSWTEMINKCFPPTSAITKEELNQAIARRVKYRDCMDKLEKVNCNGVYRTKTRIGRCGKRMIGYFICSDITAKPTTPDPEGNWVHDATPSEADADPAPSGRQSEEVVINDNIQTSDESTISNSPSRRSRKKRAGADRHRSKKPKKQRIKSPTPDSTTNNSPTPTPDSTTTTDPSTPDSTIPEHSPKDKLHSIIAAKELARSPSHIIKEFLCVDYWDSALARKVFDVMGSGKGKRNVKELMRERQDEMYNGFMTAEGYRDIVHDRDEQNLMSHHEIFIVRQKCKYLYYAIKVALEKMGNGTLNWLQSCEDAIKLVHEKEEIDKDDNDDGVWKIKCPRTLTRLFLSWRRNGEKLINPHLARYGKKQWEPKIFENYPEFREKIEKYATENLATLSAENLLSYCFETALPVVLEQRRKEKNVGEEFTLQQFLKENQLKVLCLTTICKWLEYLGFKYGPRKKCFYVDNHDSPANVAYRSEFIERYFRYERRCFRWIQLSEEKVIEIEKKSSGKQKKGKMNEEESTSCHLRGMGYKYEIICEKTGKTLTMYKFHVDDDPHFEHMVSSTPFGGHLSVRFPKDDERKLLKPIIIVGQDECIFKQNSFTKNAWIAPDGTRVLVPKDEGAGLMISSFVCREFGYAMEISKEDLEKVNAKRQNEKYADEDAAMTVNGKTTKDSLTKSPFEQSFEYGAALEGYWTYDKMVLQMEDCIDCLKVLHPEFEIVFLFDHSCGHDRQREDGLNANNVSKYYGGKQAVMHDSEIKDNSYLGPFSGPNSLKVGDIQQMVYGPNDAGPYYLSEKERETKKHDIILGTKETKKVKKELADELEILKIDTKGKKREQPEKMAQEHNIPLTKTITDIDEGWLGKPKGALQILYERGWIDPNKSHKDYTMKGKKDEYMQIMENTSLKLMMESQPDFVAELTLLQHHGKKLGVTVDRTPKCHPKMAGEGIEYTWGCSKQYYQFFPIERKRTKANFLDAVKECLSRRHLTVQRQRKFSRRAREYMLAYKSIERVTMNKEEFKDCPTMSHALIEAIVKK